MGFIWFLYSQVSNVMSQIIVQKVNGLQVISPLLKSNKVNLQRSTVALVGNLTKNPNLQNAIGKKQVQVFSLHLKKNEYHLLVLDIHLIKHLQ